ncbi:MAG: hypothetical protein K0R72_1050 [Clostridia bacterium]|jgi:hypothetical protein|nr:hypothetical protein [Clostridia bacterium]
MQVIIDERVNTEIKKYFLELGYEIIKIKKHDNIYSEISSHTDIFCLKLGNTVIYEKDAVSDMLYNKYDYFHGDNVENIYPKTAAYNVCVIDNFVIHNFKITDKKILEKLNEMKYTFIDVKQGYSRCSILPLDNRCCITSDKGIYNKLIQNDFDVLYVDSSELDIKLFNEDGTYSNMSGFIGGCSCVLNDTVIFFGDVDKLKCKEKLINYINSRGYKIKDFKKMDVIDYGSCIFLD